MNLRSMKRTKQNSRVTSQNRASNHSNFGKQVHAPNLMHSQTDKLKTAISYHQEGKLSEAKKIYKSILATTPNNPDALHLLGLTEHQSGQNAAAIQLISQASQQHPLNPIYQTNLGTVFQAQGHLNKAISCFESALAANPDYAEAYYNMGNALKDQKKYSKAISWYKKAIDSNPNAPETYYNLANCHLLLDQLDQALFWFQTTVKIKPDYVEAYNNMGNILQLKGNFDEAFSMYHQALKIRPYFDDAYYNLGRLFHNKGKTGEAVKCYQKVLELKPDYIEAYNNLGIIFTNANLLTEAEVCFNKVISLRPSFAEAYNNHGNVLKEKGKLHEATDHYKKALQINPDSPAIHSNLLNILNFQDNLKPKKIFAKHTKWGEKYSLNSNTKTHLTTTQPGKKHLRIGYISPDFRQHSVAYYIEPIIKNHNRSQFTITCYSDVARPDSITDRIKEHADLWQDITKLSDQQAAALIQRDNIDILIDLAGHTSGNRLPLFTERLAHTQITYLGYPNTTGINSMDYRITDPWADPEGKTEHLHTEKLIRIPTGFLCYQPDQSCPDVSPAPVLKTNRVTFGSFNQRAKINDQVISLWAEILLQVENSDLIIKTRALSDEKTKKELLEKFIQMGIAPDRLKLYGHIKSNKQHLEIYNHIDIGLDTFPYNGTTTTCDALWMGVPVVTLAGKTHVSRVGVSLLSSIGLTELIAESSSDYIKKTVSLSNNQQQLTRYRMTLRDILRKSHLTDAKKFTASFEKELIKLQG